MGPVCRPMSMHRKLVIVIRCALLLLCSTWLCCTQGCGRGDAAPKGTVPAAGHRDSLTRDTPRLPGDRLAFRFVDHAGEARLELPPPGLAAAWSAFRYPYKLPSPYSGLRGETALRAVEVALADADVAGYGQGNPAT